jgi:hypothetical protein
METVDVLPPDQMASWLRETAGHTRSRGNGQWTGNEVRAAKHVAFRIEQAAALIEQMRASLSVLHDRGTGGAPIEELRKVCRLIGCTDHWQHDSASDQS